MGFAQWLTVAGVCLLGAASPGPSLLVVVRHALGGRELGLVTAWSHAIGIGAYAVATLFGLAALLAAYPQVVDVLRLLGAVYLVWLGVGLLRESVVLGGELAPVGGAAVGRAARDGLAMALTNPKIAFFFLALFSQFVDPAHTGAERWGMALVAVAVDGVWYSLVALLLTRPPVMSLLRRRAGQFGRGCGAVFLLVALWLLLAG